MLLNITPDHLGWHKSHKNYALAKIKLFDNMVDDDLAVVDVEDAGIHEFDEYIYTPGRRICKVAFDEPEGEDAAFVRDGKMIVRLKGVETPLIATSELKISGHHNVINALCAATAALAVGADVDGVCRGLASFQPLEHRVEPARNSKRAKAGYHHDGGILPFALRNQVRFVRTWSSPYMARLGVVAAYVRTGSLYTSDNV